MLKTTMIWPTDSGGSAEVSSGSDSVNAIQSITITECVNSGEQLTLGSVCASMIEAKIFAPGGALELNAGSEVTVYRSDGNKNYLVGIYVLEKPTRPTANTVKITGYDFVTKLDKELSSWLSNLTGWPYRLVDFAGMVCAACGIGLANPAIPNGEFRVQKFTRDSVTGRQLMQWVGELCGRFCRISRFNPANVEFAWYEDTGKHITAAGDLYYFQNSLSFEDFETAPIDAVQISMADAAEGALWPDVPEAYNRYVITGNPLLSGSLQADIKPALSAILSGLDGLTYTPCKVSIPASMDLRAGHIVSITDKNGKTFKTCVMTKTQSGQKDTLECTGSYRRDTASASSAQAPYGSAAAAAASAAQAARAAKDAAKNAVDSLTHEEVFNKLTNNGTIQGIYVKDGKWYVNAELAKIVNLIAEKLKSVVGTSALTLDGATVKLTTNDKPTFSLYNFNDYVARLYFTDYDSAGNHKGEAEIGANRLYIGGYNAAPAFAIDVDYGSGIDDGVAVMRINTSDTFKALSWKDNGDGTYSLIGRNVVG